VQLLPKSNATVGLLAHLFVSKFADALPFYRQQKIFARYGLDLPRATMSIGPLGPPSTASRLLVCWPVKSEAGQL
jgi:transposase